MSIMLRSHEKNAVKFYFYPDLDYQTRLWTGLVVLSGGLLLQAFGLIFLGALCLLGMSLLLMAKGCTNKPEGLLIDEDNWQQATSEQIERVLNRAKEDAQWGASPFNGGGGLGVLTFVIVAASIAVVSVFFLSGDLRIILIFDSIILIGLPVFFCGWISSWKPPGLIEIKAIDMILRYLANKPMFDVEVEPYLKLASTEKGDVPFSARMMLKFPAADESVIGLQVQVSINSVQGKSYPYMYCVILARQTLGLHDKVRSLLTHLKDPGFMKSLVMSEQEKKEFKLARYRGEIVQLETSNDVDIVVIRQNTKGTGYHTTDAQMVRVLNNSIELARNVFM